MTTIEQDKDTILPNQFTGDAGQVYVRHITALHLLFCYDSSTAAITQDASKRKLLSAEQSQIVYREYLEREKKRRNVEKEIPAIYSMTDEELAATADIDFETVEQAHVPPIIDNQGVSGQPHEQLMNNLLKQVKAVDFRKLAGLVAEGEDEKLKVSDYHVIVSQQVLELASNNHWGICRRHDFFYLYNGSFWQAVNENDLRRFLGAAAEKMGVAWLKARSVIFTKKLFEQFAETAYMPAPVSDEDVVKINLQNGTFRFTTDSQQLQPPVAEDFLTHQLPFAYDPAATAPQFQAFLDRVQPDQDCQKLLAEYLGYVFISPAKLKLEKAMLLYGSGANGKSVFFEIVMGLLGQQNVSNYSLEKLTTEPAYRAQIQNKLLNYASEISGNLESTMFKALASVEPVEARLLYGQAFTMTNYAKLLANTNELPNSPEHTHAYFRRFLIVPFNVTIPDREQDKQLSTKIIQAELSGVFNWVLAGLRRLLSQGNFTDCEAVQEQLESYKKQSDSARLFLDENGYSPDAALYIMLKDMYRDYRSYCSESGLSPVKKPNFQKRLNTAGIQTGRRNVGNVVYVRQADNPY